MFESVAPEKFAPRSRKIFYESLPASIAVHAAAAVLIVIGATWNVTFPIESPHMATMYTLALEPTPPPPPPGPPAAPKAAETPKPQPQVVKKEEIVAPTIIPDEIPVMQSAVVETKPAIDLAAITTENTGAVGGIEGGLGSGDGGSGRGGGNGSPNGMAGGMPGGIEGGIPADTVIIKRHQPLPMSMTPVSMVYPFYPEEARQRGWEDAVTVRYVIGKDGRVKTVTVLEAPQRPVFEKTVVRAISHWRFRPLVKNGVKHEVIHELVVNFRLVGGAWKSDS